MLEQERWSTRAVVVRIALSLVCEITRRMQESSSVPRRSCIDHRFT